MNEVSNATYAVQILVANSLNQSTVRMKFILFFFHLWPSFRIGISEERVQDHRPSPLSVPSVRSGHTPPIVYDRNTERIGDVHSRARWYTEVVIVDLVGRGRREEGKKLSVSYCHATSQLNHSCSRTDQYGPRPRESSLFAQYLIQFHHVDRLVLCLNQKSTVSSFSCSSKSLSTWSTKLINSSRRWLGRRCRCKISSSTTQTVLFGWLSSRRRLLCEQVSDVCSWTSSPSSVNSYFLERDRRGPRL